MIRNRSLNMDVFDAILDSGNVASDTMGCSRFSLSRWWERPSANGVARRLGRRAFLSFVVMMPMLLVHDRESGNPVSPTDGKPAMFAGKLP